MERMTGTPIEKWSDTPIPVVETPKVEADTMAKEMDPFMIGNVRRGLEDQLEQNDNMLNGIIDNLPSENNEQPSKTIAELEAELEERIARMKEMSAPSEKKESLIVQLREFKSEVSSQPFHGSVREMERCL
jgi:hypothetical protein